MLKYQRLYPDPQNEIVPVFPQTDMRFNSDHSQHEGSTLTQGISSTITHDWKSELLMRAIAVFGGRESSSVNIHVGPNDKKSIGT